jgi:hypothetical protein
MINLTLIALKPIQTFQSATAYSRWRKIQPSRSLDTYGRIAAERAKPRRQKSTTGHGVSQRPLGSRALDRITSAYMCVSPVRNVVGATGRKASILRASFLAAVFEHPFVSLFR